MSSREALGLGLRGFPDDLVRWERAMGSSAIEAAMAASRSLAREIDALGGRSLSRQISEATSAVSGLHDDVAISFALGESSIAKAAQAAVALPESYGALARQVSGGWHEMAEKITRDFTSSVSLDRMIRDSFAGIDWKHLQTSFDYSDRLARLTSDLISSYRELPVGPLGAASLFSLDALPELEVYAHASIVRTISRFNGIAPAEAEEEDAEDAEGRDRIDKGSQITLESLLYEHDPNLGDLWKAAIEGLGSRRYSAMQFCHAQRELLRTILRKAAPDSVVREWTNDPEYVSDCEKRYVTWPGRIAYVCHRARRSEYTHFAITDAKAAAGAWKLLNRGAHQVPVRLTSREVSELRMRSNCLVLMTLQLIVSGH